MEEPRKRVVQFCQLLYERGLNCGYAGNVSLKEGDRIFITPAGFPKHRLKEEQILETDLEGNLYSPGRPSSEVKMHYALYKKRPDIKAVIHAHPPFLSIIAITGLEFKPVLPEMEMVLKEIAIVPYARPGTQELAFLTSERMSKARLGVLLNHGALALGESLEEAFDFLEMGESLAHTLIFAHLLGKFNILAPEEVRFFRGEATG